MAEPYRKDMGHVPWEEVFARQAWCERAGFAVLGYRRQSPEHYRLLVEKRREDPVSASDLGGSG